MATWAGVWAATYPYTSSASFCVTLNQCSYFKTTMPPAKAKLKVVEQAAANVRFVNVPRVSTPPNYHNWLETLLETPQNRKTFMTAEKTEVDDLLRVLAGQQFKKDNNLLTKALAQVHT
jgi:hypothetical protein